MDLLMTPRCHEVEELALHLLKADLVGLDILLPRNQITPKCRQIDILRLEKLLSRFVFTQIETPFVCEISIR
jgi:hypothetical protein